MLQRGRKSAASLALAGPPQDGSVIELVRRITPPDGLTEGQRQLWTTTVESKPAEWFGPEHAPMLAAYVRHAETINVLTTQIESFDPQWLEDDDGVKRYEKLTKMRAREVAQMNSLMRAMRLTQQSIYRADKAGTLTGKHAARKPWQTHEG